jgi:adenylate cyclase
VHLTDREQERKRNLYVPDWEAYECFIHGRFTVAEHYFKFSRQSGETPSEDNLLSSRRDFERAMELDPGFAGGYAGLSWAYSLGIRHGLSRSPDEDRETAIRLAEQAVEVDPDLGWSHTALASARLMQRRHDDAISSARRAVELQPSDADGHAYEGLSLICAGRPGEALEPLDHALRLDPRYQPRTLGFLAIAYFGLRRFDDAVRESETVVGPLDYGIHFTLAFMAGAYMHVGRTEEAKATVRRLLGFYPGFTVERLRRLFPYKNSADMDFLCDALIAAGLPED